MQKQQRQQQLQNWINQHTQFSCEELQIVAGDASFRRYFRFSDRSSQPSLKVIAVDAPPEHENSQKFVDIACAYHELGVPVPEIYAHCAQLGFYCQEDFGDKQFANQLGLETIQHWYSQALSHLPNIQRCVEVNNTSLPPYDQQLLSAELYLFTHWLTKVHLNITLNDEQKQLIDETYEVLKNAFITQPQVGVHRDYHCRNLMVKPNGEIGIIDFQDAVIGPLTYDIVSLLRDCYQGWPDSVIQPILKDCHTRYYAEYPWHQFKMWFDLTGLQRHIKASGIFARLCHRDGKMDYLKDIPRTLEYIIQIGYQYEQTASFAQWVEGVIKPSMLATLE